MNMIKANCYVYNKHLVENLGIETEDNTVRISFLKEQVASYREYIDDNDTEVSDKNIYVYLKCGESFLIDINYDDFTKIMMG